MICSGSILRCSGNLQNPFPLIHRRIENLHHLHPICRHHNAVADNPRPELLVQFRLQNFAARYRQRSPLELCAHAHSSPDYPSTCRRVGDRQPLCRRVAEFDPLADQIIHARGPSVLQCEHRMSARFKKLAKLCASSGCINVRWSVAWSFVSITMAPPTNTAES